MGLLKFYFSTSFFKSLLESFCSSLVYAFLNRSGSSVYDVLSFLEPEAAVFLDSLYYLELSSASALEDNVEGALFFFLSAFSGASYDTAAAAGSIPYSSLRIAASSLTSFTVRFTSCSAIALISAMSISYFVVVVFVCGIVGTPLIQQQLR